LYTYVRNRPTSIIDPQGLSGYGNPVSGPTGPVGPSDPYAPGGAYYCPPKPCNAKCQCGNNGGTWTQNNGYDSWKDCMDKNWVDSPPSEGPPIPSGDLPPIIDILNWEMHGAICNHAGCSTSPSTFFPGS
jgi:hypothetical protein